MVRSTLHRKLAQKLGRANLLLAALAAFCLLLSVAQAQSPDPDLMVATGFLGKPLLLKGMFVGSRLRFDASGKVEGSPETGSFTLAGVQLSRVKRNGTAFEFEGDRTVLGYVPDSKSLRPFLVKDSPVKITVADTGGAPAFQAALDSIFSRGVGVDMASSMPDYWQHYFDLNLPWPEDGLGPLKKFDKSSGTIPPKLLSGPDPEYSGYARRLRVEGASILTFVVDANGMPKRIRIAQPAGYGLDESAVKAVSQYRFAPATLQGHPIPVDINIRVNFRSH